MEPLDVIEGNMLIAQWLGYTYFPYNMEGVTDPGWKTTIDTSPISKVNYSADLFRPIEERSKVKRVFLSRNHTGLQYHSSYDWLMPVYKKITEIASGDVDNNVYSEYVIMAESLRRGLPIIEVWKHAVECIKLIGTVEPFTIEDVLPQWKRKHHLESILGHWTVTRHNDDVTLTYIPNKKYTKYNIKSVMDTQKFEELIGFINQINGQ